jgi:hypothetical protein
MPKIVFTELEKGVKVGKGTFNVIKGNSTYDGKPWEKRYFAFAENLNAVAYTLKPGDKVECVTVKQGQYWNLEEIKLMERAAEGAAPPEPPPATGTTQQGKDYKKREKVATAGGFRPPEDISRTEALRLSTELVKVCLEHPASHEGPLTFPEACDAAISGAQRLNAYITGQATISPAAPLPEPEEDYAGPKSTTSPTKGDDIPY